MNNKRKKKHRIIGLGALLKWECLPRKYRALSSNPSTSKQKHTSDYLREICNIYKKESYV
jgi:hypothetical protein